MRCFILWSILILSCFSVVRAGDYSIAVPMIEKGTATYYVKAVLGGQEVDLLVDTGAGYACLNKTIISRLRKANLALPFGSVEATLADGKTQEFPVYMVSSIRLGGCVLDNIEVVETPANARNLLGLSVLKRATPFSFVLEPAELRLSHCSNP